MTKDQSGAVERVRAFAVAANKMLGIAVPSNDGKALLEMEDLRTLLALADSRPVGEPEVVKRARANLAYRAVNHKPPSDRARDIIAAYEAGLAARPPVEGGGE